MKCSNQSTVIPSSLQIRVSCDLVNGCVREREGPIQSLTMFNLRSQPPGVESGVEYLSPCGLEERQPARPPPEPQTRKNRFHGSRMLLKKKSPAPPPRSFRVNKQVGVKPYRIWVAPSAQPHLQFCFFWCVCVCSCKILMSLPDRTAAATDGFICPLDHLAVTLLSGLFSA